MHKAPLLAAESIGKAYGQREVLKGAYLHATSGRIVGLLGRNGAGKSTLLRIAAGCQAADHGTIRLDGAFVARPTLHVLARQGLWYVAADAGGLSQRYSVAAHMTGVARQFDAQACETVAERLQLSDKWSCAVGELSGGERRLLHLALVMLRRPRILLADELLRELAPLSAECATECLRELRQAGCAIVLTGHELTYLRTLMDAVVWVHAGSTRAFNSFEEASDNWGFQQDFLIGGRCGDGAR